MSLGITHEQREAIVQSPGCAIEVEDELTSEKYVLIARHDLERLIDEELRRQLQVGFDQADAGDVGDWDIDQILAEAHQQHAAHNG